MNQRINAVEIIDTQNTIISIQAGVINELFLALSQHITAEEMDNLSCIDRINEAATLKRDLDGQID